MVKKAHAGMSVKELKNFIKEESGGGKPIIPLSQKKAGLIADLKAAGLWKMTPPAIPPNVKGKKIKGKPPPIPPNVKGKRIKVKTITQKGKKPAAAKKPKKEKKPRKKMTEQQKLDRQAQRGAIKNFNKFFQDLLDLEDFTEELVERESNVLDSYSWGSEFYRIVKRVTKRDVDYYEELTDSQQEQFSEVARREAEKEHKKFMKEDVFDKAIKGKKFKSYDEALRTFVELYKD